MNLPNILSISRILLLFPIIIFFEYELHILSLITFVIASITDFLDGYFARMYKISSDLGSLLDLLADKIFISTLLIWMTFNFESLTVLICSILIVSREISISYLRLFIISKTKNVQELKADILGKYKTAIQMIGLGLILISPLISNFVFSVSLFFISFSAIISWYSFVKYLNKWIV
tara:strand:+ start:2921 stop:3448 length:528 start_codon:yes stop_codon:yes gene_type:complete